MSFKDEIMEFDNEFPSRIASTRSSLGMTQGELAEQVGVVQRQVAAYEGGESRPRQGTLLRLAEALGSTPEWLSHGAGERPNPKRYSPTKTVRQIPIISLEDVSKWLIHQDENSNFIKGLHPTSCEISNAAFAVRIDDPAMAAANPYGVGFPKNCLVIFDPSVAEEDQDFVLVLFADGKVMFRQYFKDSFKTQLVPLDPRYGKVDVDDYLYELEEDNEYNVEPSIIPAVFVETTLITKDRICYPRK